MSAVVATAPPQMPVPAEAQTQLVYSGMAMTHSENRGDVLTPRTFLPLWVRVLAAPLIDSPVLPPPPPRIQSRAFQAKPVLQLAGGGLCMGLAMANNRTAMRLELVAGTRAAALNLRF